MMNMKKIPKIMLILFTSTSFWAAGNISLVSFNNSHSSSVAQLSGVRNVWRVISANRAKIRRVKAFISIAGKTYLVYADCQNKIITSTGGAPIPQDSYFDIVHQVCFARR